MDVSASPAGEGHPTRSVDEVPPAPKMLALGFQHVLFMDTGAVAMPLIVGRALQLSPEQVAVLISADLFACGVAVLHGSRQQVRQPQPRPGSSDSAFHAAIASSENHTAKLPRWRRLAS